MLSKNRQLTRAEIGARRAARRPPSSSLHDVATLFITCGVPGAGKTTLARRLEKEHAAIRLTPDEWLRELFPDQVAGETPLRGVLEGLLWSLALRALVNGCNVVLDYGLWGRSERDRCRTEARAVGARVLLFFLDPPREELIRRLEQRNAEPPEGVFTIPERLLDEALAIIQRPTAQELDLFDTMPGGQEQRP